MSVDETGNPWVQRSRTTAYENPWIEVWHDEVTRPDGEPGIYGVVHFRTRAVGIVAMDERQRVLLVGQHRYTLDDYSWEIPEGGVPQNEDLLEGAKRELREETGYTASTWRLLVRRLSLSNSVSDETGCLFVATGLVPGAATPDPTELIAIRWVGLGEAIAMIDAGAIHDTMSQVALLRFARDRHE